jgi:hypothetical protein
MSKLPPIPPENRSTKGPGEPDHTPRDDAGEKAAKKPVNSDQQGQQANKRINTTHQGYQQDR